MARVSARLALLSLAAALLSPSAALRFFLRDRERACFSVWARAGETLHGYAAVENGRGAAALAVEIAAPDRSVFFERHQALLGAFSARTPALAGGPPAANDWDAYDDDDEDLAEDGRYGGEKKYEACLMLTVQQGSGAPTDARRAVNFRLHPAGRADGEGSGGDAAVKSETVDGVAGALKGMFHEMQGMMRDLQRLQRREKKLLKRQDTCARVLRNATLISILILLATSGFQYSHYLSYFTSKKLC